MISYEIQEGAKNSYFDSTVATCMLSSGWQIYLLIWRTDTISRFVVRFENRDLFVLHESGNVHTKKW